MPFKKFSFKNIAIDTLNQATESLLLTWKEIATLFGLKQDIYKNPLHKPLSKPVSAILIGAGNRGNIYADYAIIHPDELNIIGVADQDAVRNGRFARKHNVIAANRFYNWEDVFKRDKFADAVIIATPDQLHAPACLQALGKGYDVLLEKPIALTEHECRQIHEKAISTGHGS